VPQGGELDHDRRYPEGPTSAGNLAGYCTPNHRGKHQAPGFEHQLAPDGTLTVRTPTGMSTSTTPEPYCDVIQGRVPFDPGPADR
jgi:hypothetical protein